jgi:hypothetical protein
MRFPPPLSMVSPPDSPCRSLSVLVSLLSLVGRSRLVRRFLSKQRQTLRILRLVERRRSHHRRAIFLLRWACTGESIPVPAALPKNCASDAAVLRIGMSRIVILHI